MTSSLTGVSVSHSNYGYKYLGGAKIKSTCSRCGEEYSRYESEIDYNYFGKHFCSYNCKMKYIKETKINFKRK